MRDDEENFRAPQTSRICSQSAILDCAETDSKTSLSLQCIKFITTTWQLVQPWQFQCWADSLIASWSRVLCLTDTSE
ncbi:hypothetical protein PROFUN_16748 [Planoprotostelium fungivorum]|uniref:Uncharacterized protein n=1 Tax=Planoprotostelium fungivorum TaxID=1890364 RepID=A0A2P6MNN8_9EUKA|nr:hypothetical protein PROFUN_16748 [Planoprotostelium fungivorum]